MIDNTITAYPLCWPVGKGRTASWKRERSNFGTQKGRISPGRVTDELLQEILHRLYGKDLIISTNIRLRLDGMPYADQRKVDDPGVAVYFTYKNKPMCFACDRWIDIHDNLWAIAKTIDALRGIARWGSGDMLEAAFTGFVALPKPDKGRKWWQVLELASEHQSEATVEEAYRRLAMKHHPDRQGGSSAKMAEINVARSEGLRAVF